MPASTTAMKRILKRLAMRLGMVMTPGAAAVQQSGANSVYRPGREAFKARGYGWMLLAPDFPQVPCAWNDRLAIRQGAGSSGFGKRSGRLGDGLGIRRRVGSCTNLRKDGPGA